MENFVKVTSKIDGQVILSVSAINFRREFLRDGMSWNIPRDTFEEIINYPGVANMFEDGTLGVDNPEILEEYGIIPVKTITREEALYHPDKHIVKMPLEATQLLCNALHFTGEATDIVYKPMNMKHPCSLWIQESLHYII